MSEQIEKKEDKQKMSRKQKLSIILGCVFSIIIVAVLSIYFVAGSYFFDFALTASFKQIDALDKETMDKLEEMPAPEEDRNWLEQANLSLAEITSRDDGYKLRALELKQENYSDKWVITIHGYRGNCFNNGNYAKEFFEKGYNVLMPNLEGHGFSEGKYVGMGYTDRLDVLGWIDYIINKDALSQIVLHGVSMGGATVMFTTGEKLPANVKCAIEDCGYSNVKAIFKHVANEYLRVPFKNTLLSSLELIAKIKTGIDLDQANCVKALKKSTTPTMFIHGTEDNFVPFKMLDIVYNANKNIEKEKLVVQGANHAYSATFNPELYFNSVFNFVNKYVK